MTGGESDGKRGEGPVPVRDLMRELAAPAEEEAAQRDAAGEEAGAAGQGVVGGQAGIRTPLLFEMEGALWSARPAGTGAYGTGRSGAARLLAVHFYRQDEPEVPVREALVPAGRFKELEPEELRELFGRATPIELDR